MLIDTHAHLTMPDFGDLDDAVKRAEESGVASIINVGFDLDSSVKAVELSKKYPLMFSVCGIHPHHADQLDRASLEQLEKLIGDPKNVGIGHTAAVEIGPPLLTISTSPSQCWRTWSSAPATPATKSA